LLGVVTRHGRKRGHWLTKPAANEGPAWQQERLPGNSPKLTSARLQREVE